MKNSARFPVPLPETVSERQLAEAAQRPLPVIGTTARIMLLCARESLDADQVELIQNLCASVDDWDLVLQQAEFRLIVPLVHRHLSGLRESVVPAETLAKLKARARAATIRNLAMTAVYHRLVREILDPLEVPHVFFKGPSLAYRYYREPGLRQFRDIDLLIPRSRMVSVGGRLREKGFSAHQHPPWSTDDGIRFLQRFGGGMNWLSPEGVLIEMPSSLDEWDRLPTDQIIADAETIEVAGLSVPVPPTADFICYLFKHHSRHHWARLHWIADLHAILNHPETDLPAILDRARNRGFERTVKAACSIHNAVAQAEPWNAQFDDPFAHELFRYCLTNLEGDFNREIKLRGMFPATSIDIDSRRRQTRHSFQRNLNRFRPHSEDFLQLPLAARWHSLYYLLRPFLYVSRKLGRSE